MHISRIDLNLFVVFEAVLREGSITAASRALHLSQPAVSHALGRLRLLYGDPLFERAGRGVQPTALARSLAPGIREALAGLQDSLDGGTRFAPEQSDRCFTLALRDMLELVVMPPLCAALQTAAPRVSLAVARIARRRLAADLGDGRIDLAVDVPLPADPDLRQARLAAEPLVVLARRGHPRIGPRLTLEDYLAEGHVQVSSRRSGPGIEDLALARRGIQRAVRLRCRQYATACRTVAATDLIATLPARHARIANLGHDNQLLALPLPDAAMELTLYWHRKTDNDPANRWLRQQLTAALNPD